MAKKKQLDRVFAREGWNNLLLADLFVYEVEIYRYAERSYNLEDTRTISAKACTPDMTNHFRKDGGRYKRVITLIAAPLEWLSDNKYREVCQDQSKTP